MVIQVAQLLQRDRTAGWVSHLAKSGRMELGDNIYGRLSSTTATYLASKEVKIGEKRKIRAITDSCINSATDRFLQRRFTKFSEITQCNGNYAVHGHSRSPILVPIESTYIRLPISD